MAVVAVAVAVVVAHTLSNYFLKDCQISSRRFPMSHPNGYIWLRVCAILTQLTTFTANELSTSFFLVYFPSFLLFLSSLSFIDFHTSTDSFNAGLSEVLPQPELAVSLYELRSLQQRTLKSLQLLQQSEAPSEGGTLVSVILHGLIEKLG